MSASARGDVGEGLIQTQSRVKLRLYVKCRGGEEVCEERVDISWFFFLFFFFPFCSFFIIMGSLF